MKLSIEKVIYGGQGLSRIPQDGGRRAGMRAFVPFTLPGEEVEAEIFEDRRGYCVAEPREVLHPSEWRITPPCPYFGKCGGCQFQHADYSHQLELKCEMLVESLHRAGVRDLPQVQTLADKPFAYRNRVRLHVQSAPEFALGYRESKSHRLCAIERCPIAMPLLEQSMAVIRRLGVAGRVPDGVTELELFTNHAESELLMTVWSHRERETQHDTIKLLETLGSEVPQLCGALMIFGGPNGKTSSRTQIRWGKQTLGYCVDKRVYAVSAGSFFQTNSMLLDRFVMTATEGKSGKLAWDLYAGVGLFSLPLKEQFQNVVSVESGASAIADLKTNLTGTGTTVISSNVIDFLRGAARRIASEQDNSPDLVLLDPPRTGAGVEACRLLARCSPKEIVYVSCDPATLGRDMAVLIQSGYRLNQLHFVDMFPQTYHLETIAFLVR